MHPRDERDCICLKFWIARDERKGRRYDGYDLGTADYAWEEDFAQVPRLLKEKVREVLIDSGCEDLVTE